MIVIYFFAKKHGYRSKTSFTFKEAIHTILQAIPALLLIIIVIGGIIGGVFTATEVPLWPLYTACCSPCLAINPSN